MSAARILVVDDESEIRTLIKDILADEGYEVEVAAVGTQARVLLAQQEPDVVLLDIWMPDIDGITLLREWSQPHGLPCSVVMMSGHGTVETAVEATRLGAADFIEKPLSMAKLLRAVERALEHGKQKRQATRTLAPNSAAPLGRSRIMQSLREQAQALASHDASVIITGESGTGREAFARFIHSKSPRARGPFVMIVAAGLTEETAAVALHGSEDASGVRPGYLEEAAGGTLFINGLQDLPVAAQRLLFADLDTMSFTRSGGTSAQKISARLLCSALPTTESQGDASGFRGDLLSRLSVVTLQIPPLREYTEDVPELLRSYVDRLVDEEGLAFRRFGVAAQNRLRNYPWPGNVRELRNLVHRLLILGGDEEIRLEEVERAIAVQTATDEPLVKQDLLALPLREAREHFERAYLQQQLMLCNGKVGQLAKRVGMERTHLYRKLRSLGVDFRQSADD
jgi:two-component system nitrogen regulation response regulator NtrX